MKIQYFKNGKRYSKKLDTFVLILNDGNKIEFEQDRDGVGVRSMNIEASQLQISALFPWYLLLQCVPLASRSHKEKVKAPWSGARVKKKKTQQQQEMFFPTRRTRS